MASKQTVLNASRMKTIKVKEPESGVLRELKIQPVSNFAFPGWLILIPEQRNVLLYREDGKWKITPNLISSIYVQSIGDALDSLKGRVET